jgi:hypothetical protein
MTKEPGADRLLRLAIRERRVVKFVLDGCERIAEPHDYGIMNGTKRLFFYQVGGQSRSGRPQGWRWAQLKKIEDLQVLEQHFRGPRSAPSGQHVSWDERFATVATSDPGDEQK